LVETSEGMSETDYIAFQKMFLNKQIEFYAADNSR